MGSCWAARTALPFAPGAAAGNAPAASRINKSAVLRMDPPVGEPSPDMDYAIGSEIGSKNLEDFLAAAAVEHLPVLVFQGDRGRTLIRVHFDDSKAK